MKIIQIDKQNCDYFLDMDPLSLLLRGELYGCFALGLMLEDSKNGIDIPAGLVILGVREDLLIIHWMCVSANVRKRGLGDKLLSVVMDMARKGGIDKVGAYFPEVFGRELACVGDRDYFREHRFYEQAILPGEWRSDVKMLLKQPYFNAFERPDGCRFIPLKDVPKKHISEVLKILMNAEGASALYDLTGQGYRLSGEVSILEIDKSDGMIGALMVEEHGGELFPVYFCANSDETKRSLCHASLTAAKEHYGGSAYVQIIMHEGRYAEFMEDLMPGWRMDASMLIARTEDLLGDWENFETEYDLMEEQEEVANIAHFSHGTEDWTITLEQLAMLPMLQNVKEPKEAFNVGTINISELYRWFLDCGYYGDDEMRENLSSLPPIEDIDMDISGCVRANGKIKGMLLVCHTPEGCLMPVFFRAMGSGAAKLMMLLMIFSVNAAKKIYPGETPVIISPRTDSSRELAGKIHDLLRKHFI